MNNRRSFLKTSALTVATTPSLSMQQYLILNLNNYEAIVKQPEQDEIIFVRENTPITFHISKSKDEASSVSLLSEEIFPGSHIPMHKHLNNDEYFFILTGTGTIMIEDKTYDFKPGTTSFIPRNTWHSLENNGTEKLIFHFGFSPAGFEDFFRAVGTPKGEILKQKSKQEMITIGKKYGMVFK